MMKYIFLFFLFACFISCSDNKKSTEILPPQKMQDVLWDYIRIDVFTSDYITRDSATNLTAENVKLQKQVFLKHKVTKEAFLNSYKYYEAHPEEMGPLLDSMINRKRREDVKKDSVNPRKLMMPQ